MRQESCSPVAQPCKSTTIPYNSWFGPSDRSSCASVVTRQWSTSVPLWLFPSHGIGCGLRQYRRCNLTGRLVGQWKQVVIQVDIDKNTSKILVLCHVVKHIHPEEVNSLDEAQYLLTHTVPIQGTLKRLVKGQKILTSQTAVDSFSL